jgi:hypothetical protein
LALFVAIFVDMFGVKLLAINLGALTASPAQFSRAFNKAGDKLFVCDKLFIS